MFKIRNTSKLLVFIYMFLILGCSSIGNYYSRDFYEVYDKYSNPDSITIEHTLDSGTKLVLNYSKDSKIARITTIVSNMDLVLLRYNNLYIEGGKFGFATESYTFTYFSSNSRWSNSGFFNISFKKWKEIYKDHKDKKYINYKVSIIEGSWKTSRLKDFIDKTEKLIKENNLRWL